VNAKGTGIARGVLVLALAINTLFGALYLGLAAMGPSGARLLKVFDLDSEANPPAWWSGSLLLLVGVVLLVLVLRPLSDHPRVRPLRGAFATLGLAFVFLSADEIGMIHEDLSGLLRGKDLVPTLFGEGFWIVPYAVLGVVLVAALWRYIVRGWHLWGPQFRVALAGGVLFVSGGVLVEMVGYLVNRGLGTTPLQICIEEMAEMTGEAVMLFAVVSVLVTVVSELFVLRSPDEVAALAQK